MDQAMSFLPLCAWSHTKSVSNLNLTISLNAGAFFVQLEGVASLAEHERIDLNVSRRGIDRTKSAAGAGVLVCSCLTHNQEMLPLTIFLSSCSLPSFHQGFFSWSQNIKKAFFRVAAVL